MKATRARWGWRGGVAAGVALASVVAMTTAVPSVHARTPQRAARLPAAVSLPYVAGDAAGRDDDIDLRFRAAPRAGLRDIGEPAPRPAVDASAEPVSLAALDSAAVARAMTSEFAWQHRASSLGREALRLLFAIPDPRQLLAFAAGVAALVGIRRVLVRDGESWSMRFRAMTR